MKPSEKEPVEELIEILSRPLNCPTRSLAELAELAESLHKDPVVPAVEAISDSGTWRLDSSSIHLEKSRLAQLSPELRRALLPEARRQEALRWKEQYSHDPWYANYKDEDWERMARSYFPPYLRD